jgi:hypothetical protein
VQNATSFNVFCGYAQKDEAGAEQLKTWLKFYEREGVIRFHYDLDIIPGSERKKEIDNYLNTAHIILLLISVDFINSDDGDYLCRRAIARHKQGEAFVLPIVYRLTPFWKRTPLGELQAVPKNEKPVVSWEDQDEVFAEVDKNFIEVLKILQQRLQKAEELDVSERALLAPPDDNAAGAQSVVCRGEDEEQRQLYLQRFTERLSDADILSLYIGHHLKGTASTSVQRSLSSLNFLEEVYHSGKKCWILLGDPGLGKTTLLHMLGIEHAARVRAGEQSRLPVFIELSGYAEYIRTEHKQADLLSTFAGYLATRSLTDFDGITGEEVERHLKSHGYFLLLDALDEIGEPGLRHKVLENIKVIMEKSRCMLLITSRISANTSYDAISRSVVVQELSPFTPEQIAEYLRHYQMHYAWLPADWCEKLLKVLPHNRQLQELLSTPLLLNMMADILSQSASERPVPDQYVELCERYITYVIEERPRQRPREIGAHRPIIDEPHRQRDYFASIAYSLHLYRLADGSSFDVVDYVRPVTSHLSKDEVKKDIDQLVTEVGILQKRPLGKYAFRHTTFQEFFVADYLLRKLGNLSDSVVRDLLLKHLSDPSWRQIIIFYYACGYRDKALAGTWLLTAFLDQEDDLFATHTFLAADCLQAAGAEYHPHYQRMSQYIKQRYHETPYYALQDDLFRTIRQVSGHEFLPFLQEELRCADRERRIRALQALGQVETEERARAISLLRRTYDEEPGLRTHILDACLSLGPDGAIQVLQEWLEDDPLCIIAVIAKLTTTDEQGWKQTTTAEQGWLSSIVDILDPHCPHLWMCEAVEQLGQCLSPCVIEMFQQWLEQACDHNDRAQMLRFLHALRFPVQRELQEKLHQRRISLNCEEDPELFLAFLSFAGYQKDERANEPFFDVLIDHKLARLGPGESGEQVQLALLRAWLALERSDTHEYIAEYLSLASPTLWKQSIPFLVETGQDVYFDLLSEQLLVSRRDWSASREGALILIRALYQMSKKDGTPPLLKEHVQNALLALFKRNAASLVEGVEASVSLLGQAQEGQRRRAGELVEQDPVPGSLQRMLEMIIACDLPALNEALASSILDPSCPEFVKESVRASGFCTYYLAHPLANRVYVFQLRLELLTGRKGEQSSSLLQQKATILAALEHDRPEVRKKAVEMACRLLDSTDKEVQRSLLRWLHAAESETDAQTIHLLLLYLGESGTIETIRAFPRFLYGDNLQLQQTAFKTIRDIVRRHEADIPEVMTMLALGGQSQWQ